MPRKIKKFSTKLPPLEVTGDDLMRDHPANPRAALISMVEARKKLRQKEASTVPAEFFNKNKGKV